MKNIVCLFVFLVSFAMAGEVFACRYFSSFKDAYEKADLVFVGTVQKISPPSLPLIMNKTTLDFKITEILKGDFSDEVISVMTEDMDSMCSGFGSIAKGEKYLVFTNENAGSYFTEHPFPNMRLSDFIFYLEN